MEPCSHALHDNLDIHRCSRISQRDVLSNLQLLSLRWQRNTRLRRQVSLWHYSIRYDLGCSCRDLSR
eukprot:12421594-Karenia_brevis.AAC.1